jgi:hypothetical protein
MVALQPMAARAYIEKVSDTFGIENGPSLFEEAVFNRTGFHMDELSPVEHARHVKIPTLML